MSRVSSSQVSSVHEAPMVSRRSSQPRTWAGLAEGAQRATHYLHLSAFPCEQCKGPVILGWMGIREDDIARETGIRTLGAVCLSCGRRPEPQIAPVEACQFRPVRWEWTIETKPEAIQPGGDPLQAERLQDAKTDSR